MSTTTKNLSVKQGETYELEITHKATDGVTDVAASDVTIARMQVRTSKIVGDTLLDFDSDAKGGITVTDGLITVTITATQSTAIEIVGVTLNAVYDLEVVYADGKTERKLEGKITFDRQVTR